MPIDTNQSDNGNVFFVVEANGDEHAMVLGKDEPKPKDPFTGKDQRGYLSHFASCPAAEKYRKA